MLFHANLYINNIDYFKIWNYIFSGLSELIYFNTKSSKTFRRKYFAYQK